MVKNIPHILVVEDEIRMAASLEKGLRQYDYQAAVANSGLVARGLNI
jgi:DNA-binding response OmpR family regulator